MATYKTVTFTPTVAAEAHTALDVLWDTVEVASVNSHAQNPSVLIGVTVVDKAANAVDMEILFLKTEVALADAGAPAAMADGSSDQVLGIINTAAYIDISAQEISFTSISPGMVLDSNDTSVYCAGVATATPTPASTSDYVVTLHLMTT